MSNQPPNIAPYRGIDPQIASTAYIHPSAQIIGDVVVGERSSIWCGAVARGDVNFIRIGADSNIQDLSTLHVSHRRPENPEGAPLIIGDRVTVGHNVILHGCKIGDECLIGMGSIVMDNVVLEPRTLLGAGSLVPEGKVLQGGFLYLGRPAKLIRALTEEELAHFAYSAAHYVRLAGDYRG
ncbi:MAG: gamma carbonic anhydrase family protein [Sulfuricella sp.]|nr:gamma carbonic anhydrase family protein [Sulfuricella sp.]